MHDNRYDYLNINKLVRNDLMKSQQLLAKLIEINDPGSHNEISHLLY